VVTIDLNVRVDDHSDLDSYVAMAKALSFKGIVTPLKIAAPFSRLDDDFLLGIRTDLGSSSIGSLKKGIGSARRQSALVAVQLGKTQVSNWAAEDTRVDILTLSNLSKENSLKLSTARLAAQSGTVLEILVAPLLETTGLDRSKIIKRYRECAQIAVASGMHVILASGASKPIQMRSPASLQYVGLLLGMDLAYMRKAVNDIPRDMLERNERNLSADFVARGVQIVQRGETNEED
jgi:RNase P/RNase MRP subunit p30